MENRRRLLLRVSVKLMFAFAVLSLLWILITGGDEPEPIEPTIILPLPSLAPGESQQLDWHGRRLLLVGLDPTVVTHLSELEEQLVDPEAISARLRASTLLLVLDYGGELGCPLEWVGSEEATAPRPWLGGLRDRCRGTWYDPAGRIYRGQRWNRNLTVPPYRLRGGELLLGAD